MKKRSIFTVLIAITIPITIPISSALANSICPIEIEPLTQLLVRDLPSYANRAAIKGRSRSQLKEIPHVVIASQPELEPIDLPNIKLSNVKLPNVKPDPNLHQVFITTLERQAMGDRLYEFQQYHWLFLTKTRVGWRLTQSFSRIGRYPQDEQLTITRESSQGAIAQGIKTWLRDCHVGSIRL
jgi:hypothetical protein